MLSYKSKGGKRSLKNRKYNKRRSIKRHGGGESSEELYDNMLKNRRQNRNVPNLTHPLGYDHIRLNMGKPEKNHYNPYTSTQQEHEKYEKEMEIFPKVMRAYENRVDKVNKSQKR